MKDWGHTPNVMLSLASRSSHFRRGNGKGAAGSLEIFLVFSWMPLVTGIAVLIASLKSLYSLYLFP